MGDGKLSAPRVTAKRSLRFQSARSASRSFTLERAPVILDLSSTTVRVGYSESFKPQHIIPLGNETPPSSSSTSSLSTSNNLSESQWYFRLSPVIQKVYDRLMCNPSSRRVCVVHENHYLPRSCQAALTQLLWNMGVPAITFMSALEILPVAQGWKRGMIVQISADEAVCVCHADGHILPLSYQSVPSGYKSFLEDPTKLQVQWTERMSKCLIDENNPQSLVTALLKCLETCPRDIKIHVISNLVFCGEGMLIFPELASKVGKRLKEVLEGSQQPMQFDTPESASSPDDPSMSSTSTTLTTVPVQTKTLKTLAGHLAVSSSAPHRADWISWVAASLWVATWIRYDDEESRIRWTFAPSDK